MSNFVFHISFRFIILLLLVTSLWLIKESLVLSVESLKAIKSKRRYKYIIPLLISIFGATIGLYGVYHLCLVIMDIGGNYAYN